MKTQRQKFEDWIDSLTFDQLHSLEERSAWIAWQAAIESVVVELPPAFDAAAHDATYYDYAYSQLGIHSALDEAGIKYE